jgi:hypothetical protein
MKTLLPIVTGSMLLLAACVSSASAVTQTVDQPSIAPTFRVSAAEEVRLVAKARGGDVQAMIDLYAILSESPAREDEGFFWLVKAADSGDARCRKLVVEILARHDDAYKRGLRRFLMEKWAGPSQHGVAPVPSGAFGRTRVGGDGGRTTVLAPSD